MPKKPKRPVKAAKRVRKKLTEYERASGVCLGVAAENLEAGDLVKTKLTPEEQANFREIGEKLRSHSHWHTHPAMLLACAVFFAVVMLAAGDWRYVEDDGHTMVAPWIAFGDTP